LIVSNGTAGNVAEAAATSTSVSGVKRTKVASKKGKPTKKAKIGNCCILFHYSMYATICNSYVTYMAAIL